jgi:hypothetical protein
MLIPFPIAFFVATLLCDLVFWGTHYAIWTTAALWLLGAGIIMAALAATAGLTDFIGDRRIRNLNDAWYHAIGNATAVLQFLRALPIWNQRGSSNRADLLGSRGLHPAVHGLEGLGDGLPPSRRRLRRAAACFLCTVVGGPAQSCLI